MLTLVHYGDVFNLMREANVLFRKLETGSAVCHNKKSET